MRKVAMVMIAALVAWGAIAVVAEGWQGPVVQEGAGAGVRQGSVRAAESPAPTPERATGAAERTAEASAEEMPRIPLIGEKAPAFEAETTQGRIKFPEDYKGKWVILFSHPADFTPVCSTEFMMFAKAEPELEAINAKLVGLSIDSNYSHIAWLRNIEEKLEYKGMKNVAITFPVISDVRMDVARKYGMVHPTASNTSAVRAVFFIDPQATIRAMIYYPLSNGRNIEEIKRLLIALQTTDAHKVSTPADWQPGEDVIVPPPNSCGIAAERVASAQLEGLRCPDWFLCFKEMPKEKLTLPPAAK